MHFFRITKEEQRSTSPPPTKEMKDNFHEWFEQDKDVAIPINLLLSEFYDSGQLFKSNVSDFWPLYIGILNLPANLRG